MIKSVVMFLSANATIYLYTLISETQIVWIYLWTGYFWIQNFWIENNFSYVAPDVTKELTKWYIKLGKSIPAQDTQ